MDIRLGLILHENQEKVHRHPARYKVIKAGKRFGKTKWALFELCQQAGRRQNEIFWYLAPTYSQAKKIAWWELKWLLPKMLIARSIENELMIELINGSRIQLIGCDNEDALRGPRLGGVVFDEAAYIAEHIWPSIISGQLLGSKQSFAYFISSPNRRGRNWFTGFHAEAKRRMELGDKDHASFYFTIYDNPTLNPEEIARVKEQNTDDTWNLEYMAVESEHSGVIFSEFSYVSHVHEFAPDSKWELARGHDWGIDHPTVCLWVYLDTQNKLIYVDDEYVKSGNSIEESCKFILGKTSNRFVKWDIIDPSTSKRNSHTLKTDKDEYARNGIYCASGDNNHRGYDITKMFFKRNQIIVHPRCKNLIAQLKNLQWGDKDNDDCTDVLRYLCVRIHDLVFGGAGFDGEEKPPVKRAPNTHQLANKRNGGPQDMSWINDLTGETSEDEIGSAING